MIRRLASVLLWSCAGLAGACLPRLAAAEPGREQFAYAIPIDVRAGAPLQWLELPTEVYRDAVDPALRDLRVLNGNGEEVPFALQRPPTVVATPVSTLRLPLFPLRGDQADAMSELTLRMRDGSSVIELRGTAALAAPVTAYLIDARGIDVAIESLLFDVPASDADFSVSAVLDVSEDLANWRNLAGQVPLARLRHAGEVFESRGVSFRPTRARFWRLSGPPGTTLPDFAGVSALPVGGDVAVDRRTVAVAGRRANGAAGEYEFDVGARLPVDRLDLELPDVNTVARVRYFARRAVDAPWRPVSDASVYRLQTAQDELRSPPVAVAMEAGRYWRVVVDPRGGGLGAGIPKLRAGWLAHRVVFVARGASPFELVYGNYAAQGAETPLEELLPRGAWQGSTVFTQAPAVAGAARLAGGVSRLTPPPPPGNWRLGLLWAALGVGVLSLAALAWRLARQMRVGS